MSQQGTATMTYIFQVVTKDAALQLKTEVTATDLTQLNHLAKQKIKQFPKIIGMKYIIAQYKDVGGKLVPKTLKTDVISGGK